MKMNLVGHVYGEWTVLKEVEQRGHCRYWLCRCSCGTEIEVFQGSLRRSERNNMCISCRDKVVACLRKSPYGTTHRFYEATTKILARCLNKNNQFYKDYGGRGIKVSKKFNTPTKLTKYLDSLWFEQFGHRDFSLYGRGIEQFSIDRKNNDGNYEPGNLRFATKVEQANNKRCTLG